MVQLKVNELLSMALPKQEWIHLANVINYLRAVDPDFSPSRYGFDKLRFMLESVPDIIEIEKQDLITHPPVFKCKMLSKELNEELNNKNSLEDKPTQGNKMFQSLYSRFKKQPHNEIFAQFPWNEAKGENWETPFSKIAALAKKETWNFTSKDFQIEGQQYPILINYLNYTFLRLQQEDKISYSSDGKRACFNTGLQTPTEKDIYATFFKNRWSQEKKQPDWTLYAFADSYSNEIKDFNPLPEIATFIIDASDLVFDLSYNLEINVDHIVRENGHRLPEIFHGNQRLAMTAIQGATEFLKEKIRRNYKVAIPHWYHDKIQLLLPLNLLQSDGTADLALVADKDKCRKIYRIKTALTMDMAYINARLICKPDRDWLNP